MNEEIKYKCMACGRVSPEVVWSTTRIRWVCGDWFCGGNVQIYVPKAAAPVIDKPLGRMKERVEQLAEGRDEPVTMCWFYHEEFGEWLEAHYCDPCSRKIRDWLLGGEKPDGELSRGSHPDAWVGHCTEDNLKIRRDSSIECDTPEHCELCGHRLSVSLLEEGAGYESDHFEQVLHDLQVGKPDAGLTPNEWFDIKEMIEAIEYVEQGSSPNPQRKKIYDRVVSVVKGLLELAGPIELFSETNLSYLNERDRINGELLQAEMLRLQATGQYANTERLWEDAAANLGNDDERFCGFYVCLECGSLYHQDYSSNSDPDRDFCEIECESAWLRANPDAPYQGELKDEEKE